MVVVVQSLGCVWLFANPWSAALQATLSFTISWSLLKPTSIESVILSNYLILCCPLLLLPLIFPRIRVFSNESAVRIRWSKYWSSSFSIGPSNEYSGLISFRIDWFDLPAVQDSQESSPAPQFKSMNVWSQKLICGKFLQILYLIRNFLKAFMNLMQSKNFT